MLRKEKIKRKRCRGRKDEEEGEDEEDEEGEENEEDEEEYTEEDTEEKKMPLFMLSTLSSS
jgi:hypothetical protein